MANKMETTNRKTLSRLWLPDCLSVMAFLMGGLITLSSVSAFGDSSKFSFGSQEVPQQETSDSTETVSTSSDSNVNDEVSSPFYTDVGERPDWVTKGSYISGDPIEEFIVVMSEKRLRELDAEEELESRLIEAVHERIDEWFAPGAGKAIGVDLDYIRENLIQHHPKCDANGAYHQLVHWSVPQDSQDMVGAEKGEAFQYCAQVKLDDEFKAWAGKQWENRVVTSRTMQTGLVAASTILALGLAFGYFTVNHKTRGFYSGRLQTIGLAGLLIIGVAAWWLANQFVWL